MSLSSVACQRQEANPRRAPAARARSAGEEYRLLRRRHQELCKEIDAQQEQTDALQRDVRSTELDCAALRARLDFFSESAAAEGVASASSASLPLDASSIEKEHERVRRELQVAVADYLFEPTRASHPASASSSSRAESTHARATAGAAAAAAAGATAGGTAAAGRCDALPPWARSCPCREELDVNAAKLEKVSLSIEASEQSLEETCSELSVHVYGLDALRTQVQELRRSAAAEQMVINKLRAEHRWRLSFVKEHAQRCHDLATALRPGSAD